MMNKAFVYILNGLISVRPLEASPNQIVLVGQSPAPHGFFPCIHYLIVNLSHEGNTSNIIRTVLRIDIIHTKLLHLS